MRRTTGLVGLCALALTLGGCDLFDSADQRVARAEREIAAHDYRTAMIELKNALQDDPQHLRARLRLAEVEYRLGDLSSAEKDLRHARELGAADHETAGLEASILLALGKSRELLRRMDAGELKPSAESAPLIRGQALNGQRLFAEAIELLGKIPPTSGIHAEAQLAIAQAMAGQGQTDGALARLDELIRSQPEFSEALVARAGLQAQHGGFAAAQADLERAREIEKNSLALNVVQRTRLLTMLGEVQLASGKVDEAAATQAELARIAPDGVVTRVLSARISMARQDYASAAATLQRVLVAVPDLVPARFLLGAALLAQGNVGQAEQHLAEVLQRAPENLEARKLLAQVRLRLGRPDAVLQIMSPVQAADDPQAAFIMGLAKLQRGDAAAGVAQMERAVAAHPRDRALQLDLAAAYIATNNPAKAIDLLQQNARPLPAMRESALLASALLMADAERDARAVVDAMLVRLPRDPQAYDFGAGFYAGLRDPKRARELSDHALALRPESRDSILVRARLELQAGDADAAARWLEKAARIDDRDGAVSLMRADLQVQRGDASGAARLLQDLRARDPESLESRLRLAALYLKQKDSRSLLEVVEEISRLAARRPAAFQQLGFLYLESGRFDDALAAFQQAANADPANPSYWLDTARAQLALGNSPAARAALLKANAMRPDWLPAAGTLALLDLREGHSDAALSRVAELRNQNPRDTGLLTLEGDLQMAMNNFPRAVTAYDQAAKLVPSPSLAVKSYRARQAGKLPNERQPLESWIASHPSDVEVRLVLAEAYRQGGESRQGAAQYELLIQRGVSSAGVLNNLAWIYYEMRDPRAEAMAARAYEAAPDSAAVADTYGWILLEAGKGPDALPLLEKAAAKGGDPSIEFHYAAALIRTGSVEQGRQRLTDLIRHSPNFPDAPRVRELLNSSALSRPQ